MENVVCRCSTSQQRIRKQTVPGRAVARFHQALLHSAKVTQFLGHGKAKVLRGHGREERQHLLLLFAQLVVPLHVSHRHSCAPTRSRTTRCLTHRKGSVVLPHSSLFPFCSESSEENRTIAFCPTNRTGLCCLVKEMPDRFSDDGRNGCRPSNGYSTLKRDMQDYPVFTRSLFPCFLHFFLCEESELELELELELLSLRFLCIFHVYVSTTNLELTYPQPHFCFRFERMGFRKPHRGHMTVLLTTSPLEYA